MYVCVFALKEKIVAETEKVMLVWEEGEAKGKRLKELVHV